MLSRIITQLSIRRAAGNVTLRRNLASQVTESLSVLSLDKITAPSQRSIIRSDNLQTRSKFDVLRNQPTSPDAQDAEKQSSTSSQELIQQFKDERLTVAQHLDPSGKELPTSTWIHVDLTLPVCSLEDAVGTFERYLREAGMVTDLDAQWNPHQDESLPVLEIPSEEESIIEAAHVVLSPFGRPNGWYLKFPNRSMVYAILNLAETSTVHIGWKVVRVTEHHYKPQHEMTNRGKGRRSMHTTWVVDDTMVRMENCPPELDVDYVRYMMSRYDLATKGPTVIKWKGRTNDGKAAPLMFIIRFASAAWARAAVREMQSTQVNDKVVTLIQYPRQILYKPKQRSPTKKDGITTTTGIVGRENGIVHRKYKVEHSMP